MREIKFRGKVKYNGNHKFSGDWIYGYYRNNENGNAFITEILDEMDNYIFEETEIDENTIGQYTGLHDENGKEIYEGDIVRDMEVYLTHQSYVKQEIESVQEAEKYRYFGNVAVVEFCTQEIASCGCCYQEFVGTGFKAKRVDLTCCEVIGNVYNNLELLEKGKE